MNLKMEDIEDLLKRMPKATQAKARTEFLRVQRLIDDQMQSADEMMESMTAAHGQSAALVVSGSRLQHKAALKAAMLLTLIGVPEGMIETVHRILSDAADQSAARMLYLRSVTASNEPISPTQEDREIMKWCDTMQAHDVQMMTALTKESAGLRDIIAEFLSSREDE